MKYIYCTYYVILAYSCKLHTATSEDAGWDYYNNIVCHEFLFGLCYNNMYAENENRVAEKSL